MQEIKGGFGYISRNIVKSKLPLESIAIYAYISAYVGNQKSYCYPSIETMAKDMNTTPKRIYKHMQPLIDQGIVKKVQNHNEKGRFDCNTYTVNHNATIN